MMLRLLAAEVTLKTRSISAAVMYPTEEMRVGGERGGEGGTFLVNIQQLERSVQGVDIVISRI
jgi:hypothetical protein